MKYKKDVTAECNLTPYPIKYGEIKYDVDENKDYCAKVEFKIFIDKTKWGEFNEELSRLIEKFAI